MTDKNKSHVVLVNEEDLVVGTMEKIEAHRQALLHRAVSVFVINSRGEWLLQRRALDKYHSGGLWTNACCTHPYPGEGYSQAADRRLYEEMGIRCPLHNLFHFRYQSLLNNGITENELDYVFIGLTDQLPDIEPGEVCEWRYMPFDELSRDVRVNPGSYTFWFKEVYEEVAARLKMRIN